MKINTSNKIRFFTIPATIFSIISCAASDPHENFKRHMATGVGQSIDVANWANEKNNKPTSIKTLKNGNIENEYRFPGECRYFFEYNPKNRVIVGWSFSGNKNDCQIPP
jgi:hypothetical protein